MSEILVQQLAHWRRFGEAQWLGFPRWSPIASRKWRPFGRGLTSSGGIRVSACAAMKGALKSKGPVCHA